MFQPGKLLTLFFVAGTQLWSANCPILALNPVTGVFDCKPPRVCSFRLGADGGAALSTANIQPQRGLCQFPFSGTLTTVIVLADAGASTIQIGFRHSGSTTNLTPLLTPATVAGITDTVACANTGGTAITIQGSSVTCSTLSSTALAAQDSAETTGGAADATTKRLNVTMIWSE